MKRIYLESGGMPMFKLRHCIRIFFLVLSTGCASVGTTTPITPSLAPTMTLMSPTPTSLLPPSTPLLLVDNVVGLIAYTSDQDGDFEIWVMNADGSGQYKLTDNNAVDGSLAWSPDGNQIAFITNRDGNDEVYVMNADGSNVRRLTQTTDASESFPAWSPDAR
jgi:dipeptidyl aminopeptidase/acylaminoacyl peptidase